MPNKTFYNLTDYSLLTPPSWVRHISWCETSYQVSKEKWWPEFLTYLLCLIVELKQTVPGQESCLTLETNTASDYKPSKSAVSTDRTNVQSGLLSVPEITEWQVQLKAAWRQSDGWSCETSAQSRWQEQHKKASAADFYFSCGGLGKRGISCFSRANSQSWWQTFCFYLLLPINYLNRGWQQEAQAYIIQGPGPVYSFQNTWS